MHLVWSRLSRKDLDFSRNRLLPPVTPKAIKGTAFVGKPVGFGTNPRCRLHQPPRAENRVPVIAVGTKTEMDEAQERDLS